MKMTIFAKCLMSVLALFWCLVVWPICTVILFFFFGRPALKWCWTDEMSPLGVYRIIWSKE